MARLLKIGDVVCFGRYTDRLAPLPAIVVEVLDPDNPEADLALVVFSSFPVEHVKPVSYSPSLADRCWSRSA